MRRVRARRRFRRMDRTRWKERNLAVQGYCFSTGDRRGVRFATGACLPLVALAIGLQSVPMLLALSGVAAVAGFTPRHPFDHVWNHAVRHAFGAPPVPPNPTRRRHAFKIGTAWLLTVTALFATGATVGAFVLGGVLLVACTLVTTVYFCVPSYAIWLVQKEWRWLRAAQS